MMERPWCRFREKHEPVSDIDTAMVVASLKVLDPKRPIREADIAEDRCYVRFVPILLQKSFWGDERKF